MPASIKNYTPGYIIRQDQLKSWYQAKPYCFRIKDRNGFQTDFYLPISPSNINITTHFATNVISTMYGTVEEHSEQRYFDIIIQGTTGFAPKHYQAGFNKAPEEKTKNDSSLLDDVKSFFNPTEDDTVGDIVGRRSFSVKNSFSTGGFFKRTQALARQVVGNISQFFASDDCESAIPLEKTGYIAFHNFYRFLLAYKTDILKNDGNLRRKGRDNHPLRFVNYKDSNQYNVAIQTFTLVRSADDPMLYNYNIVMRGYKLDTADKSDRGQVDNDRLAELGLDGVESSSKFSTFSNSVRKARNTAYSAIALAKGVGS